MKILYFINQIENSGGIERIVIDKVNYLAQLTNNEIHMVYYGADGTKSFYPIDDAVKLWAININSDTHSFFKKILSIKAIYWKVRKIIDGIRPDVIVNANTRIVSYFLPLIYKRTPKVVELHFTYEGLQIMNEEIYGRKSWKSAINNWLRRFFYSKYSRCVVLVNDDKKAWKFKNIVVIPNFTNISYSPQYVSKREKIVINVGRLEKQKDQEMLINAWKIVHKKCPEWRLEIWGGGSLKEKLQLQIKRLGLDKSVFLMGQTQQIAKEYSKASIFALSSKYEGMPLVAIEAMTAGVPCVSFDISGIRDVIFDGNDGIIVPQHTSEALAKELVCLIEDETLRANMSEKSIQKIQKFDKSVVMDMWIKLFESLQLDA